jgi:hypothetical protein
MSWIWDQQFGWDPPGRLVKLSVWGPVREWRFLNQCRLVNFKSRFRLHQLRFPPENWLGYFSWSASPPLRLYLSTCICFWSVVIIFCVYFLLTSATYHLLVMYAMRATPGLVFPVVIIRGLLSMFITCLFFIYLFQYTPLGFDCNYVCWFICVVSFAGTILKSDQRWKGGEQKSTVVPPLSRSHPLQRIGRGRKNRIPKPLT